MNLYMPKSTITQEEFSSDNANDSNLSTGKKPPRKTADRLASIRTKVISDNVREDSSISQRWLWEVLASDLPPYSKLLGIILQLHGTRDGADIFPSFDRLRVLTSMSRDSINAHIKALTAAGYIEKSEGAGRRANEYSLQIPDRTLTELAEKLRKRSGPAIGPQKRSGTATGPQNGHSGPMTGPQTENSPATGLHADFCSPVFGRSSPMTGRDSRIVVVGVRESARVNPELTNLQSCKQEGSGGRVSKEKQKQQPKRQKQETPPDAARPPFGDGPRPIEITARDRQRWHVLANTWGYPADSSALMLRAYDWAEGDLVAKVFMASQGYATNVAERALAATLDHMEGKWHDNACLLAEGKSDPKVIKGAAACSAYFSKEFPAQLARIALADQQYRLAVANLENRAAIDADLDQAAAKARLAAIEVRLSQGSDPARATVATGSGSRAHRPNTGRYAMGDDGRQRFTPEARFAPICYVPISGADANRILDAAPAATPQHVEEALIEAGGQSQRTLSGLGMNAKADERASLKGVIEWCAAYAQKSAMFEKYGTPEMLCGGTPHKDLRTKLVCLSEEFIEKIVSLCPDVARSQYDLRIGNGREYIMCLLANRFYAVTSEERGRGYGVDLQQRVERRLIEYMEAQQVEAHNAKLLNKQAEERLAKRRMSQA